MLLSLLFVVLVILTTGTHLYFVWKNKDYKILYAQLSIITLTVILGIWMIYDISYRSIAEILNILSPFEK